MVALRGTASVEDVITDSVADPAPLADWVPEAFAKQHGEAARDFHAHAGILGSAEAVLKVPLPSSAAASAAKHGSQPSENAAHLQSACLARMKVLDM